MPEPTNQSMHIYCENCGYNCEVIYEQEDDSQEIVFCPFCGEESLFEELLDPSDLEDDEFTSDEDDEEE